MAFNSPPPSDDCPELTTDNGTLTSSSPSSHLQPPNWDVINNFRYYGQENAGNSHQDTNALYIFNNDTHHASPPDPNNGTEHSDVSSRFRRTPGSHDPRSPYPVATTPPEVHLHGITPTDPISPIDIGPPIVPLSCDLPSAHGIGSVETEPTQSSSRCPPIAGRNRVSQGLRRGLGRLRSVLPNFSARFGRAAREGGGEDQPRRGLSLGRLFRRRNAGAESSKISLGASHSHPKY